MRERQTEYLSNLNENTRRLSMTLEGPAGGRGKWAQPGVPHKGWYCINVEDLGEPSSQCEMCETVDIRYVHYMKNDRYPEVLGCGAICAGHMETDLLRAETRDKKMRSMASRRRAFPDRKGWSRNINGNWILKTVGMRITIFERNGVWGGVVSHPLVDGVFTRGKYPTARQAMSATFDSFVFVEEQVQEIRRLRRHDHINDWD